MSIVKKKKTMGRKSRPKVKKKSAKYLIPKDTRIDYKDLSLMQKYLTDRGKLLSRRVTGVTTRQQRELVIAVKRARYLALLPVGSSKKRFT